MLLKGVPINTPKNSVSSSPHGKRTMSAQLPHLGGHLGQLMQAGDATSPTHGFGGRDAVALAQVQVVGPNRACRKMKGTMFSLAPFSFSCNIKAKLTPSPQTFLGTELFTGVLRAKDVCGGIGAAGTAGDEQVQPSCQS